MVPRASAAVWQSRQGSRQAGRAVLAQLSCTCTGLSQLLHCSAAPRAQDGTIQHETKLTGCLSTNVLSEGEGPLPEHGTLLAPGLNAQHHQHFFCARLDPAVDDPAGGAALTVVEVRPRSWRVHPPQALPCGQAAVLEPGLYLGR